MIESTSPRASCVLAAVTAGFLATSQADAQSAFARALPQDTMMFVSFPDIDTSLAELRNAPLGKMWFEEEVQDFFAEAIQMVETQWNEELAQGQKMFEAGHLPFDPNQLTKLRLHSFNFALTDLSIRPGVEGREPMPDFGLLIHADLGESAPVWRQALETGMKLIVEKSRGEAAFSTRSIGDSTQVLTIAPTEEEVPFVLEVAFFGDAMAASTKPGRLNAFVANIESGEHTLSRTKLYTDTTQHLHVGGAELETFLKPNAFIDMVMDVLRVAKAEQPDDLAELDLDGVDRAIDALGIRSMKSASAVSRYDGSRCISESFSLCPAQERKGLMSAMAGEIDMTPLRWVPKDAASFSIMSIDWGALYQSVVDAVVAYDPNVADEMLTKLAEIEQQVGVSVKNDIFEALGNRIVNWSLPMASFTAAPEAATIIEVENQEGLVNALKKVAMMSQGVFEIEENERRGIRVYQVILNLDEFGGDAGFNPLAAFTPTFAFKDGNAVVAFSSGDIKRAFKRMDREDEPEGDIRTNPEFSPYLQQLPANGLQSLSFTDWKANFESFYQIGTTVLAFVPLDSDIPIDLSLLPDASTLTQHLFGSISYGRITDQGFTTRTIGPWGAETAALLVGAIAAGGVVAARFDGDF